MLGFVHARLLLVLSLLTCFCLYPQHEWLLCPSVSRNDRPGVLTSWYRKPLPSLVSPRASQENSADVLCSLDKLDSLLYLKVHDSSLASFFS